MSNRKSLCHQEYPVCLLNTSYFPQNSTSTVRTRVIPGLRRSDHPRTSSTKYVVTVGDPLMVYDTPKKDRMGRIPCGNETGTSRFSGPGSG